MSYRPLRTAASADAPWLQIAGNPITPQTPFSEAASLWVDSLSGTKDIGLGTLRRIRKTTESGYRQNIDSLKLFFKDWPLADIRMDHISRYQAARLAGGEPFLRKRRPIKSCEVAPCPAGAKKVNQDIGVLKRILRMAKVWGEEQDRIHQPLPEEQSDVQRALSPEEQEHWLRVARSSARWHLIYFYSELAFATCMSTNEIRSLRLCDIHLEAGQINIPPAGAKNRYRRRTVEIGRPGDPWWHAVEWLLERAHSLGAKDPNHFLFPSRRPPKPFDPSKPMTVSGVKKRWDEVRMASGLKWFRPYDTRHTAITRLAEGGEPEAVIKRMAGHITNAMMEHYTHISGREQLRSMRNVQSRVKGMAEPEPPRVEHAGPRVRSERPKEVGVHRSETVRAVTPHAPSLPPTPRPSVGAISSAGFFAAGSSYFLNSFALGKGAVNG